MLKAEYKNILDIFGLKYTQVSMQTDKCLAGSIASKNNK